MQQSNNVYIKNITSINCVTCGCVFTPKPMGYNAKYCSKKCRVKPKRKPEDIVKNRKRSYIKIKLDTDKYQKHLSSTRNTCKKSRLWLSNYKIENGCIDCGYNKHASALQLDHEGKKSFNISDLRSSVSRLMDEINNGKCVVRCANCHSVKTWADKNKIKYHPSMSSHQNM